MRSRAARTVTYLAIFSGFLVAAGCASVLGFEDTTLRPDVNSEGGPVDDGGPIDQDGNVLPDGAPSRLTTSPASLVVVRGKTAEITVDVARGSDVTGTVTARLTNLPGGVTATNAVLNPPATSGKLTLTAAAKATLGPKTINLVADGTSLPPASIPLLVTDAPGTLDTTFDADGFVTDLSKGLGATFFALGRKTDGRIVAAGAGGPVGGPLAGWIARRFAVNGAPEPAFSTASAALPADGELHAVAIDANGKIVCVGSSAPALLALPQLTIVRLLPTGAIDTAFGGGVVRLPAVEAPGGSIGLGVAIQADGAVVVVGSRRDAGNVEAGVITRFKANGTRDAAFNGGTTVEIPLARMVGVSIDAAGAVLAAGSTTSGALPSYLLTKRTAQGAADPTFGAAGTTTFGNTYRAEGFTRLADGSMVVVGGVQQGAAAYTAGATTEKGTTLFAPRAFAVAVGASYFGVAAQDAKFFIAAGHTAVVNGEARVDRIGVADGKNDPTFGAAGTSTIEPGGAANGFDVTLFAAAVQADGRILVAGNRSNAGAVLYRLWP
ncbi:hypothetical protein BH11MYX4_BH11MYX4_27550 [soil metagenome]